MKYSSWLQNKNSRLERVGRLMTGIRDDQNQATDLSVPVVTCCPPPSLPPSHPPSHHHCQIPHETHLKSHVQSLITLSLVWEGEEAKGDRAKPRAVDCSGLIAPWSAFVVGKCFCLSVARSKSLHCVKHCKPYNLYNCLIERRDNMRAVWWKKKLDRVWCKNFSSSFKKKKNHHGWKQATCTWTQ